MYVLILSFGIFVSIKLGKVSIETKIFGVFAFTVMIMLFRRIILLIASNRRGYKQFSFTNGILRFPLSPIKNELCEVELHQISNASVKSSNRSAAKSLVFNVNGKMFGFGDIDFSEKDFSIICNSVVKRSLRCKCCQSNQVEWSGEKGHCFNCETITPKNADEFDWNDAYQA